jgi:hypothetical protein
MRELRKRCEVWRIIVVVIIALGTIAPIFAAQDVAKLVGNWSGDSICLDRQSACHDEKVVYRISAYPDDPARVKIQADNIVNGQPVTMGTGDYSYDREKGILRHEDQYGSWTITVKGNTMDGTMSRDNTPFRHLTLKKEE